MANMNVEEFKLLNFILGFGLNKGLLNLHKSCVKSNQFCKGIPSIKKYFNKKNLMVKVFR
jgi:hypothetical protein